MKIVSIYPCPCDPAFRHEANVAIYDGHRYYSYEEAKLNQTKDFANCLFPERALISKIENRQVNLKRLEVVSILDTTENLNAMNKVFHKSHRS